MIRKITKNITLYAVLVFLVISGFQAPCFAQATTNCDSLLLKIKEIAQRHVKNKENMKTEVVVTIYSNHDGCYSSAQIAV